MTWSYSGNPGSSAKDAVRFLIGDTDSNTRQQLLQDEEIAWMLTQYNNSPTQTAIRACEGIIAKFARLADESVGQVRISFSQRSDGYRKLLNDLRSRSAIEDMTPYAGGISKTDKKTIEQNADRVPPDFKKHMMENEAISPWVTDKNEDIE